MTRNSNSWRRQERKVAGCVIFFYALIVAAQTPPAAADTQATANKNAPEMATRDATPTFTTRSNLVVVRVVVRDKDGRVNGTLQKEDFQLFDKGKPQFISRFSLEKTTERKAAAVPPESDGEKPNAEPPAPMPPNRYVAYVFDDLHVSLEDLARARTAVERNLTELPASSRAAIFTTSGQDMLDFTDDVARLRDTLRRIQPRSILYPNTDCPNVTYYQADLIQNKNDQQALQAATQDALLCANLTVDTTQTKGPTVSSTPDPSTQVAQNMAQAVASRVVVLGDQQTRLALKALDGVVRRISSMPGQRSVVVVSPGFLLLDQRFDEVEIMDHAIRANVIINTLDARGLYALVAGGDASNTGNNATTVTIRAQYRKDSALIEGDVLGELADGTGGAWFHDNNDLDAGLKRIAAAPEYYYVLGFSPENLKFDGSYHNLKVSVRKTAGDGLTLQARRGYFAPKHEMNAAQEARRELEEALFSRDEWRDIPVEVHTQFFKSSDANAKLSVLTRIDVRQLHFRKADGRNLDVLTVASGLFDRNGNYVGAVEKTVDMHLKDETLSGKLNSGITVKSGFDVAPGSYFIRTVVKDAEGQKMAALNGAVEIP